MPSRRASTEFFFGALLVASAAVSTGAVPTPANAAAPARVTPVFVPGPVEVLAVSPSDDKLLGRRQSTIYSPPLTAAGCLPAGTNATVMNTILSRNGPNASVVLCPGVTYPLSNTLIFRSSYQSITTLGAPTGSNRATLQVGVKAMAVAVYGACDDCTGIALLNIQIDGMRPSMGIVAGGAGLVEFGGNPSGQRIENCKIFEPRGWTAVHIIEGYNNNCRGAQILNNQIGPSGTSPNSARQFSVKLQSMLNFLRVPRHILAAAAVNAPGQWADGISNACAYSTIKGNTVTDATDGQIVIFGAPGTQVISNTIISKTRVALGGINLVDFGPWDGNFTGVMVSGNTLRTDGAMTKIGIAMGTLAWGATNVSEYRNFGATVKGNTFVSTAGSTFAYGIGIGGMNDSIVSGNAMAKGSYAAAQSAPCIQDPPMPYPQAIVRDMYTTTGSYQKGTGQGAVAFLICAMPVQYGTAYVAPAASSTAVTATATGTATFAMASSGSFGSTKSRVVTRSFDDELVARSEDLDENDRVLAALAAVDWSAMPQHQQLARRDAAPIATAFVARAADAPLPYQGAWDKRSLLGSDFEAGLL